MNPGRLTGPEQFRTGRLQAERLRPTDLADLCRMHGDPLGMRTLGGVRSDAETRDYLAVNLAHWDRYGYGLWIFRDGAGTFVGRAGIRHIAIGDEDEVELAYSLTSEFWGRGLATEIAEALLEIAFRHLRLADLIAFTLCDNRASRRVMVKAGFRLEKTFSFKGLPHVIYRRLSATTGAGG